MPTAVERRIPHMVLINEANKSIRKCLCFIIMFLPLLWISDDCDKLFNRFCADVIVLPGKGHGPGSLKLTPKAWDVLRGEETFLGRLEEAKKERGAFSGKVD